MKLLTGDITKIETDAIVNAASPDLRRSPGICDAIFAAADTRALTAACKKLRRCPVGTAVVTPSFGLPCKYIIHVAKSDAQISLRLSKKLKGELTAQAKRERRSVTALILRVMEEYLKNRESEK